MALHLTVIRISHQNKTYLAGQFPGLHKLSCVDFWPVASDLAVTREDMMERMHNLGAWSWQYQAWESLPLPQEEWERYMPCEQA